MGYWGRTARGRRRRCGSWRRFWSRAMGRHWYADMTWSRSRRKWGQGGIFVDRDCALSTADRAGDGGIFRTAERAGRADIEETGGRYIRAPGHERISGAALRQAVHGHEAEDIDRADAGA